MRVLAFRPDDLQAHRQSLCGQADRRCGCGQIRQTGEPGKEQLLGVWHRLAVDLDGAFVTIGVAVVQEGWRRRHRRQQYIKAFEEFVPGVAQFCTRFVGFAPGAVQQCGPPRHCGAVAIVVVGKRRRDLLLPGKILVAQA